MLMRFLLTILALCGCALAAASSSPNANTAGTIYLIRHGEKKWVLGCLNAQGEERAANATEVLLALLMAEGTGETSALLRDAIAEAEAQGADEDVIKAARHQLNQPPPSLPPEDPREAATATLLATLDDGGLTRGRLMRAIAEAIEAGADEAAFPAARDATRGDVSADIVRARTTRSLEIAEAWMRGLVAALHWARWAAVSRATCSPPRRWSRWPAAFATQPVGPTRSSRVATPIPF